MDDNKELIVDEQNEEINEEAIEQTLQPEGDALYEVDVQIKSSDLFDYSLRHNYMSFSGLLTSVIGALMIYVYFVRDASILYLIFGIIVIVYVPINLFLISKQQSMQEVFKTPLHFAMYENGMEVSQGELKEMQSWDNILKVVSTTNSIIVYTGKNRASIFPRRELKPDATALIQVLSTHVDPKKMKVKQ